MSSNAGTTAETRPGAYFVAKRAAGSYPAWGRQAPAGQAPSTPISPQGLQSGPGSPQDFAPSSIIDAECQVVSASTNIVDSNGERPTRCTSRRAQLRNIGFTVVGEGGSARILPFDTQMMSSRRLVVPMQSLNSIATETSQKSAWSCALCSYENADVTCSTCSICGSSRQGQSSTERSSSSLSTLGTEVPTPEEPVSDQPSSTVDRRCSFSSVLSKESGRIRLTNMEPIGEDNQVSQPSMDKVPARCMKKSASFKELMGMSFAKWSNTDNGPWACASCTYLNPEPLHLTCEVCGQPRLKGEGVPNESANEFFNSSFGNGHALNTEDQDKAFQELTESMIERERMEELIKEQERILIEMRRENERGCLQSSNSSGSVRGSSNLNDCRWQVEETKQQLQKVRNELERVIEHERQEIASAERVQLQRRVEIEREEGVSLDDFASPDNVYRQPISPAVLDWMAQQRMLDDWKLQRSARVEQLQEVRRQQERVFEMYEGLIREDRNR